MAADLLLEEQARRDYKLEIIFYCNPCKLNTKILIHRTDEEAKRGGGAKRRRGELRHSNIQR